MGGKHKEIVFLETESAKECKKKFYELIKTKIVAGYLGKIGNISSYSSFETASSHSRWFFPFIVTLSTQ